MKFWIKSDNILSALIASALYNGGGAPKHKDLLRRIDYAAIFVMIAGTCTPPLSR